MRLWLLVTRQAMYFERNTEACMCRPNHCCRGRTISITYSQCLSVALSIQHAMRMRYIVTCDLLESTVFFYIIS